MKKLLSLALAIMLCLSLTVPAFAASTAQVAAAERLHSLELFNGVGTNPDGTPNFDLDRAPSRAEAVTMLVRLLGKEDEAKSGTWSTPFTDVPTWAAPYVGYAYAHKYTNGISKTAFGSSENVNATQYLTFILRALGYTSGTDFAWDSAWTLTDELGITNGKYTTNSNFSFTRGDAALVSSHALDTDMKSGGTTLLENIFGTIMYIPILATVYNTSADENELRDIFMYADGIVESFHTIEGYDYLMLNTDQGKIMLVNSDVTEDWHSIKVGDSLSIGFLYMGYSDAYQCPAGLFCEVLEVLHPQDNSGNSSDNHGSSGNQDTQNPSTGNSGNTNPSTGTTPGYYIGNRSSKVFHRPTCSSVDRMKNSNKVQFSTRNEAISKGYTPCKNCKP